MAPVSIWDGFSSPLGKGEEVPLRGSGVTPGSERSMT